MLNVVAVFLGGGFGSLCRYGLSLYLPTNTFPWATLATNILACFLLGCLMGYLLKNQLNDQVKLLIGTGFCGGFSTFSTLSKEVLELGQTTLYWTAISYLLASIVLGILAVSVGIFVAGMKN